LPYDRWQRAIRGQSIIVEDEHMRAERRVVAVGVSVGGECASEGRMPGGGLIPLP
jgi:hypothetical protein